MAFIFGYFYKHYGDIILKERGYNLREVRHKQKKGGDKIKNLG